MNTADSTSLPPSHDFGVASRAGFFFHSTFDCHLVTHSFLQRVALGSPRQSRGEDAHADTKQAPRKRLRLTRRPLEMDSAFAPDFPPDPGGAGGDGANYQSSVDIADVDRSE